ncbi:hypothetical protein PVK06_028287 [Gossypium arboreum]|uniref:Uncharacterized protein n=1 Tax=Gossypium arboreum TaxID=29729 RepID=A0ABR0P4B3_GOSAR|nr:hypothetical protein PVK06_028287 [Gossypium arboreum]
MARVKATSIAVESSHASASQPKIFFNAAVAKRGKSVPFDKDHINAYFTIEELKDEHSEFAENITPKGLAKVLEHLCVQGKKWIISSQECYTIEKENVPLVDAEDVTPNKGGITRTIFTKLRGTEFAATSQHSQASPTALAFAAKIDSVTKGATVDKGKATKKELEKSTSAELEKDVEEGKEDCTSHYTIYCH